jgi:cell division protein FtsW
MKLATTLLVFCVASLLMLGMVMLYSSSMAQVGARYLLMQLLWAGLGLAGCAVMATVDYQHLKRFAWPIYGLAILLLMLVLIPGIGAKVNGARRWLDLGGVRFQSSEFAKIALVVALAAYASQHQRHMGEFQRGLLLPSAIIAGILGLVFVEPDRGTSILLAAVSGMVLVVAGMRIKYFLPPVLAGGAFLAWSLWNDPMRMRRIFSWIYLEENKEGVGYQAYQAMLALGSGGISGVGLGSSRQKLGFLPEHHTDFLFPIIGEELGVFATLGIVGLFLGVVLCGLYIAKHAREPFGFFLACGITFLIGLQSAINIGVVTSALPNKGLPLPFISYGGSSLLMMLTAVGMLLSIARRAEVPAARARNPFGARDLAPMNG